MEEHHINIEEAGNLQYPKIVKSINKDVCESPPFNFRYSICRVSEGLRKAKPEAYEPVVVSIGPYHLQNPKLQAMKKCKLWYLHSLLKRRKESVERYIAEFEKLEGKVRRFYAESIDLDSEKFVEMMLLDTFFILEFFRDGKKAEPAISVEWMRNQIGNDLMLHENQLPFFLLSQFYDMTKDPQEEETFMEKALYGMESTIRLHINFEYVDECDPQNVKHLLHLVHIICKPLHKSNMSAEESNRNKIVQVVLRLYECIHRRYEHMLRRPLLNRIDSERGNVPDDSLSLMPSAVELKEAGVKFKEVKNPTDLFDIKFNDGSMEIPCLSVEDSTDIFFRNLIAFEQLSLGNCPKYFTDYMDFMDQLINSEKDVELLRDAGIISNFLGDDKQVSELFNKLGDGVTVSTDGSIYCDVHIKVNKYRKRAWNKMMAKLRHNYFNTPWAAISTIAAIVLLGLTIAQTIAAYLN